MGLRSPNSIVGSGIRFTRRRSIIPASPGSFHVLFLRRDGECCGRSAITRLMIPDLWQMGYSFCCGMEIERCRGNRPIEKIVVAQVRATRVSCLGGRDGKYSLLLRPSLLRCNTCRIGCVRQEVTPSRATSHGPLTRDVLPDLDQRRRTSGCL